MGVKFYFFHYHFLSGGVTDVIRMSAAALLSHWPDIDKITLVSGREENLGKILSQLRGALHPGLGDKVDSLVVPEIDYREKVEKLPFSKELAHKLINHCGDGGSDTIWWVHNYHLGKNPPFTDSLFYAAEEFNQKMILHIHDFPECSRYENLNALSQIKDLTEKRLYLRHSNIRYAVINKRDHTYLLDAGLQEDELFLINNPVPVSSLKPIDKERLKEELFQRFGSQFPAFDPTRPLYFYPVRTIRRKNVLELGLLMLLLKNRPNLIVSLPGFSPLEKRYSDLVQRAFEEGLIPGLWGIGAEEDSEWISYHNIQRGCDAIVSGSVQEGFGYMFVNTLHWQKPLLARYLNIIDGFETLFDGYPAMFYRDLLVPLSDSELEEIKQDYNKRIFSDKIVIPQRKKKELLKRLNGMLEGEGFDFSYLSTKMQLIVLSKVQDPEFLRNCQKLNQTLLSDIEKILSLSPINKEGDIEALFGERGLVDTYKRVIDSFEHEFIVGDNSERGVSKKLVDRFSELEYLRLIYD